MGPQRIVTFLPSATELIYSLGACLFYASDAADEEDSVDLGGRRVIIQTSSPRNPTNLYDI